MDERTVVVTGGTRGIGAATVRTFADAGAHVVTCARDAADLADLSAEVREAGGAPVDTFLALLFLAHRGEIKLRQDDLFGDLWIRDPSAPRVGDEAVAD